MGEVPHKSLVLNCPMQGRQSEVLGPIEYGKSACSHCGTRVAILAGMSLLQIDAYMRANPGACIMIGGALPSHIPNVKLTPEITLAHEHPIPGPTG